MATAAPNNEKTPDSTSKLDSMEKKDLVSLFKKQILLYQRTKSKCSELTVEREHLNGKLLEYEKKQRWWEEERQCIEARESSLRMAVEALKLEAEEARSVIKSLEGELEEVRGKEGGYVDEVGRLKREVGRLEVVLEESAGGGGGGERAEDGGDMVEGESGTKVGDKDEEKLREWDEMMMMMQAERTEMAELVGRLEEGLKGVGGQVDGVVAVLEAVSPERDVVVEMGRKVVRGEASEAGDVVEGLLERVRHLRCLVDEVVFERDEVKQKILHLFEDEEGGDDNDDEGGDDNDDVAGTSKTHYDDHCNNLIDLFNNFELKHKKCLHTLRNKLAVLQDCNQVHAQETHLLRLQLHQKPLQVQELQSSLECLRTSNTPAHASEDCGSAGGHDTEAPVLLAAVAGDVTETSAGTTTENAVVLQSAVGSSGREDGGDGVHGGDEVSDDRDRSGGVDDGDVSGDKDGDDGEELRREKEEELRREKGEELRREKEDAGEGMHVSTLSELQQLVECLKKQIEDLKQQQQQQKEEESQQQQQQQADDVTVHNNDHSQQLVRQLNDKVLELNKQLEERCGREAKLKQVVMKNKKEAADLRVKLEARVAGVEGELVEERVRREKEVGEERVRREREVAEVEKKLQAVQTELEEAKKDLQQSGMLSLEMSDYERTVASLSDELQRKQACLVDAQQQLHHAIHQKKSSDHLIETLEKQLQGSAACIEELNTSLTTSKHKLSHAEKEAEEERCMRLKTQTQRQELLQQVEEHKLTIASLSSDKVALEGRVQRLVHEQHLWSSGMEERVEGLQRELTTASDNLCKVQDEYLAYKVRVHSVLKQQKERNVNDFEIIQTKLDKDSIQRTNTQLTAQLKDLSTQLSGLKDEKGRLVEECASMQAQCNNLNKRLKHLETACNQRVDRVVEKGTMEREALQKELRQLQQQLRQALQNKEESAKEFGRQLEESVAEAQVLKLQLNKLSAPLHLSPPQRTTNATVVVTEVREDAEGSESTETHNISTSVKPPTPPTTTTTFTTTPTTTTTTIHPLEAVLFPVNEDRHSTEQYHHQQEVLRFKETLSTSLKQAEHLRELLNESEATVVGLSEQASILKAEVRRLERNQERDTSVSSMEYLKNVIMKFLTLRVVEERAQLVPVLTTMLKLSPQERLLITSVANGNEVDAKNSSSSNQASWSSYINALSGGII